MSNEETKLKLHELTEISNENVAEIREEIRKLSPASKYEAMSKIRILKQRSENERIDNLISLVGSAKTDIEAIKSLSLVLIEFLKRDSLKL